LSPRVGPQESSDAPDHALGNLVMRRAARVKLREYKAKTNWKGRAGVVTTASQNPFNSRKARASAWLCALFDPELLNPLARRTRIQCRKLCIHPRIHDSSVLLCPFISLGASRDKSFR
jgi:hypothetical protein